MSGMESQQRSVSFIVRLVRGRRGVQLEVIDLHSGEQRALRNLDDLWRLLRRLSPGLR